MIVPLLTSYAKPMLISILSLVQLLHSKLIPKRTWKFFPHHTAQDQKMKVPPVDNSGSTRTGRTGASQTDTVKKAEFDKALKEMMVKLEKLENKEAPQLDTVKKADLDQVMVEVYNGLRELHYRMTDLEI